MNTCGKNPKEEHPRPKALYMTYFAPWDWIISVTSYRSEFNQLINISDFRDSILSQTFGKTGYSYVLFSNGDVVIHPHFSGNLWDTPDANIRAMVRRQCETRNGKLFYSWKNPGEKKFRDKLVIYNYIKEYDWIVASTSYLEEFYAPLQSVRNIMVTTILAILILIFPATFIIARGITRPLQELEKKLSQVADGNFSVRMESKTKDEIGKLAVYFNHFMEQLAIYSQKIETEIDDRRRTEELFFKAFHASPSGVFIVNINNHLLIDANRSFLNFIGYQHDEVVNKSLRHLSMFRHSASFVQIADLLNQDGRGEGHGRGICQCRRQYPPGCDSCGKRFISGVSAVCCVMWRIRRRQSDLNGKSLISVNVNACSWDNISMMIFLPTCWE